MTKIHIDIKEILKYILIKNTKILKIGGLGSKLLADFGFSKAVLKIPPPPQ
jgi:hypothetical protein